MLNFSMSYLKMKEDERKEKERKEKERKEKERKEKERKAKKTKSSMNDKQKWFVIVGVVCLSAILLALLQDFQNAFDVVLWADGGVASNWIGFLLFGILCSSITGYFLFADKK